MRQSLASVHRRRAAAYRGHPSSLADQTLRNKPVKPRRFKPRNYFLALIAIVGFAIWFLILSSL